MNRYLLFAYNIDQPRGGMRDCVFMTNDWWEIRERWAKLDYDCATIYDCESGREYSELEVFARGLG